MQFPGNVPSERVRIRTLRGLCRAFNWDNLPRIEATVESMLKTYLSRWFWIPALRHAAARINPRQTSIGDPSGSDALSVLFTISGRE